MAQLRMGLGKLVNMKYCRDDALQSDQPGIRFLVEAGYNPEAILRVVESLRDASGIGGSSQPELFSTHPDAGNRIKRNREAIQKYGIQNPKHTCYV